MAIVMKKNVLLVLCLIAFTVNTAAQIEMEGWKLVWADEFDKDGRPDAQKWDYERGFVRNYELQWYAPENAFQRDGKLVIEARPADFPCPAYKGGYSDHLPLYVDVW